MRLYDIDLELRTIFSVLNGAEPIRQRLLAVISPDHFGYSTNKEIVEAIYKVIKRRRRKLGDTDKLPIPSSRALQEAPGISDKAKAILSKARKPIKTLADIEETSRNLEFFRKARAVQGSCKQIVKTLSNSPDKINMDSVKEHLVQAVDGMQDYDASRSVTILKGEDGRDLVKRAMRKSNLIPTGFKNYDEKAGGIQRGDLIIGASPTGGGKSTWLLSFATNLYQMQNLSVCVATFELSKELYTQRLLSNVSTVSFNKIRRRIYSAEEKRQMQGMYDDFMRHGVKNNCQFAIMEPGPLSAEELGLTLKPHGFDVIVADHLNHMRHTEGEAEHSQLGMTARHMKWQAEGNNQVWISAAQMDDETQRIRYSRMIKEEADTAWGWIKEEGSDIVKMKHIKHRHHEPFDFYLQADFDQMTFRDSSGHPNMNKNEDEELIKDMDGVPEG